MNSVPAAPGLRATTYQVTDLARRHTAVVHAARHGGARIRDKDGTTLLLTPAEAVESTSELAELAGDLLRLERVIRNPGSDAVSYGRFAWVSLLTAEDQAEFVEEATSALLVALSGGPAAPVFDVLSDWRTTAAAWDDEALRVELLEDEAAPLHDVAL